MIVAWLNTIPSRCLVKIRTERERVLIMKIDKHFKVSMVKSGLRIGACIALIVFQQITPFAVLFAIAELIGVYEEM